MATSSESKDEDEGFILIIDDKCSISDSKSEQTDGFDSSPPPINEVSRNGLPNGDRLLKPLFPSSSSKSTGGSGPPQQLYRNLRQWIYCITVVNFDIEIGQSIECIFPPDTHLTEREISNICYLSFPDSNSGCMGDTQFHFRTKTCPVNRPDFDQYYKNFNSKCLQILEVDRSYFYGYVYFRQVKDQKARRGYFQKSLMILSWFPFVALFNKTLKSLAPQYFQIGDISLEAACSDMNRWPKPTPGQILNLPLLGSVTQVLIPDNKYNACVPMMPTINLKKFSTSNLSLKTLSLRLKKKDHSESDLEHCAPLVINVSNDINIYRPLRPIVAHIQLLWELVLTNEPLAIITQTPNMCSELVLALVHSIAPLKYGSDYRPFFTIHDSEYKEYISHKSPPPVILGVTNPFFVKTLQEWPHLIKINEFVETGESEPSRIKPIFGMDLKKTVNVNSSLKKCTKRCLEMKTGVYTKYKPFLQKDREILKTILRGIDSKRPSEAQNALLRRFLLELTQSFLIPLERYFAGLMPLEKNLSPFKRPPILDFKIEDFISTLNATGPQLTTGIKGDWTGLYRRFLRSPNFVCWYHSRMKEANDIMLERQLKSICDPAIVDSIEQYDEIQIVDLILKLKDNLKKASEMNSQLSSETIERIKNNMAKIINKLPEDSRALFATDTLSHIHI